MSKRRAPKVVPKRGHRGPLALFLATVALIYLTIHREQSDPNNGNVWSRAALMFAIVEHHQLSIEPYLTRTDDWSRAAGRYYSNKAPGPPLLAVPVYFVQHLVQRAFGVADDDGRARNIAVYLANAVTGVAPTLLALGLLWLVLVRRFALPPLAAYGLCTAWATGSLALVYGPIFFGHQSAAAFFAIGMSLSLLELEAAVDGRAPRLFWAGLAMGAAVACDYLAAIGVAVWTVWLAARVRFDRRLLGAWILGGLPAALVLAAYHHACFGSPLRTAYSAAVSHPQWAALNTLGAPSLDRLADVMVRPWRGLLYCTPVWALAALGLDQLRRRAREWPELWAAAVAALVYLLVLAALPSSYGGFCIGPRYIVSALPLLLLLLIPAVELVPRLFAALTALSTVLMLIAALTDPLPNEGYRDPYRERLLPLLAADQTAGQLSVPHDLLHLSVGASLGFYLVLLAATWAWLWHRRAALAP